MSNVIKGADKLVGNTPLLEVSNYTEKNGIAATIYAKLEYFNTTGSVKDRAAVYMINDAEQAGRLKPGGTIIEPTSGNMGIAIASVGAARGYKVIIVMPETMTKERRDMISAYGAEIVLTAGKDGMNGAVVRAKELVEQTEGSIMLLQFENPANAKAHFDTTGPEIWADTDGKVDIFIAGIGTGGTITGVGEFLKSKNPDVKIIAVEPDSSPVLSEGRAGAHRIQGIGANFVPKLLNTDIYDEIVRVTDADAYRVAREIAKTEGISVGISSGASLHAATVLASRPENKGKTIVALFPDSGDRYLSVLA